MGRLTKRDVDKLSFKKGRGSQQILWDDDGTGTGNPLSGFGVRVYPSGKKSFVLSYRFNSKAHIKAVVQVGAMTLEDARNEAIKNLAGLRENKPPLLKGEKSKEGTSFRDFCKTYIEDYAKPHKRSWKEDERRINLYLIPAFGAYRLDAISTPDITRFHKKLSEKYKYSANRCLEQLSKMFDFAQEQGHFSKTSLNPARGITSNKEEPRDRWVTPEELPRLAKAINEEQNFYGRMAIWLYLLTGLRRDALLSIQWKDIDLNRQEVRIDQSQDKTGRTHYTYLNTPAMAILNILKDNRQQGNPYVFPGAKTGQHLVNIEKIWQRVRKNAGIEDVRLHDLRRTLGSWMAQSGNSLHLIGRVLNHSSQSTTAIYARFAQDNIKEALENHGEKIASIAKLDLVRLAKVEQGIANQQHSQKKAPKTK